MGMIRFSRTIDWIFLSNKDKCSCRDFAGLSRSRRIFCSWAPKFEVDTTFSKRWWVYSSGFGHLCLETFPLGFWELANLCSREDLKDTHFATLGLGSEYDTLAGDGGRVRQRRGFRRGEGACGFGAHVPTSEWSGETRQVPPQSMLPKAFS